MLLSIVECGDYKNCPTKLPEQDTIKKNHDLVETIGPVPGKSVAAMRNRGARQAAGQWFFFKDEDCDIDPESILKVVRQISKNAQDVGVVGGVYKNCSKKSLDKTYNRIQRKWVLSGINNKKNGPLYDCEKLLGGALLVKKEAFTEVGGFKESIGWGSEELDFVTRVRNKGYQTSLSYRLLVDHNSQLSLKGFVKRAWFQNFNRTFFRTQKTTSILKTSFSFSGWTLFFPTLLFFSVGGTGALIGHSLRLWNRRS